MADPPVLASDLDAVLDTAGDALASLRGAHVFITGGTGFVGTWLLESLVWANQRGQLGIRATVLTRDPDRFAAQSPHLASAASLSFVSGDVRRFDGPLPSVDAAIHAATQASATLNDDRPLEMIDTVVDGTRRVLDSLASNGSIPVLFTSSGAVYGRQPPELSHVTEDHPGGPDPLDPRFAYHEGKRLAELLCSIYTANGAPAVKVARLFAFVGPHLPIDRHFAIGNFIRDALGGGPIVVRGDGTPVRSYLYAADMTAWLWRILTDGQSGRAYNVGSEVAVDIAGTARAVARVAESRPQVEIHGSPVAGRLPERYVPSTERARSELGLVETVGLDEAIERTLRWHGQH